MIRVYQMVFRAAWLGVLFGSVLASAHAGLTVPGFTAYLEPDSKEVRVSGRNGVVNWTDPGVKVLWFGNLKQAGQVDCSVTLRLAARAPSKLRLTVAGTSREAVAKADGASEEVTVRFGSFPIPKPGYQQFKLESLNEPGQRAGDCASAHPGRSRSRGGAFQSQIPAQRRFGAYELPGSHQYRCRGVLL